MNAIKPVSRLNERSAAGGQAGTSSRIENCLGFPSGISGDAF
jgi:thioredoxin reductase (NADPH)